MAHPMMPLLSKGISFLNKESDSMYEGLLDYFAYRVALHIHKLENQDVIV